MNDLFRDIATLLRREAGRTGQLTVAPEIAAWLSAPSAAPAIAPALAPQAAVAVEAAAHGAATEYAVPAPAAPVPAPEAACAAPAGAHALLDPGTARSLEELAGLVSQCHGCGLCATRTQTVFGCGTPRAQLVFVGEAPGEDEDLQGQPFVGRAGQLLTRIIENAMGFKREEVYICNVLKCRPPGNRNPAADEMTACEPFLVRQLQLLEPKVICALGGFAAKQLLKTDLPVGRLRGKWHFYHGIPVRVTYHPSYLLRLSGEQEKSEKLKVWDDVKAVMRMLNGEETVV
jgi:uracil-DNA glycosylase family 4